MSHTDELVKLYKLALKTGSLELAFKILIELKETRQTVSGFADQSEKSK